MSHPGVLLKAYGLRAVKRRGQNFLVQPATAEAIARSAGLLQTDVVLEIGAGLGALTLAANRLCARVIAVEVDRGLFRVLKDQLAQAGATNVEPLLSDALRMDWARQAEQAGRRPVVMGNLPYSIGSPLLFALLENRPHWKSATLMVQRELARRLLSPPGSKDYGVLSVLGQAWSRVKPGMVVGPEQFFPRPQVESQVVHLAPQRSSRLDLGPGGDDWFRLVVKAAFGQRRKTAANSLAAGLGRERPEVARTLQETGLDPGARAESWDLSQMAAAARALFRPGLDQPL